MLRCTVLVALARPSAGTCFVPNVAHPSSFTGCGHSIHHRDCGRRTQLFSSSSSTEWQREIIEQWQNTVVDPWYQNEPIRPASVEAAAEYPSLSDTAGIFPGRHKYLGGAVDARDGCIYGIPSHAKSVVCLYPSTDDTNNNDGYNVRTIPLPSSSSSSSSSLLGDGKFKWLRGILAHGYLYGIPAGANSVLQVDVDALWGRRKVDGDNLVKYLPLPEGHKDGAAWQWHGAALNVNKTAIYAIPSNAEQVLKIHLPTFTTSFIPIDIPPEYPHFEFHHPNKWYGGILGHDNAIYGIPYRTCSVLRIDSDTDTATLVGPDHGCEQYHWHGGIQVHGQIYAFPSHSASVLKIDTTNPSRGQNSSLLPIHRAPNDKDTVQNYKWLGGSIGADSNIYGMPCDASSILKINVQTDHCSTFGFVGDAKKKWQGGVLARDGCVYAIPSHGTQVLRIDTRNNPSSTEIPFQLLGDLPPRKSKWQGGFIGNDGIIYGIPENGYRILRVIPPEGSASETRQEGFFAEARVDMM